MYLGIVVILIVVCAAIGENPYHPTFDYCEWLGEDDINGLKHGYLSGNNVRIHRIDRSQIDDILSLGLQVYYIGGRLAFNQLHETVGLTHPFFHDLRSRGMGIVHHEVILNCLSVFDSNM